MFRFPNPLDERAARLVALGVVAVSAATLTSHQHWLLLPLAYGFLARVASGPRFSPLALLVTRAIVPRLPLAPRYVAGPPKRFAQAIGLAFSGTAAVLALGFHLERAADVVLLGLTAAASLEACLGLCLGCKVFNLAMRVGVVPASVCRDCATLGGRLQPST